MRILFFTLTAMIAGQTLVHAQKSAVDFVDPFIGTANQKAGVVNWKNGETFPGAMVPWGMVSISPHNAPGSKSGYRKGEPFLYGFGQVHLSGVGCADLGNVVVIPSSGKININAEDYKTAYSNEEAHAGYYKTTLQPSGIIAEMSATTHTSISKYSFPANSAAANILIDASVTLNSRFMPAPGYIKVISPGKVVGWTESGHFCGAQTQTQRVYFVAVFSKVADTFGTWTRAGLSGETMNEGNGVGAYFNYTSGAEKIVYVKVGISYVSIANAELNLQAEQPGWDFTGVRIKARQLWSEALSKIEVEGSSEAKKTIFYTALYHMLLHPSVFSDVNGEYMAMGHKRVKKVKSGSHFYNVFSLWDTWRNLHVFLTLFYPRRQHDMVESLLDMYRETGFLPKWELAGNDAYVMVGDPAGNVLLESYANGLRNFDLNTAFEGMKRNATDTVNNLNRPYLRDYLALHFVPATVRGSVSMTLEYCMADYSAALMAKLLGRQKDYEQFLTRSQYYHSLYDTSTGFFRPRNADGSWYQPFHPSEFKGTGFIEGSAWNYLFFVPFDQPGLMKLMGGKQNYTRRLQEVFDKKQFALYNEPDIAYPYLFNYINGENWRTQKEVHNGMDLNFVTGAGGLPGNDDCGTLSAWYVFSALGFYPVNPLSGNFALVTPDFSKATIHLDDHYYKGKTFVITSGASAKSNNYFRKVSLNEKNYTKNFIRYSDIENGGHLDFKVSDSSAAAKRVLLAKNGISYLSVSIPANAGTTEQYAASELTRYLHEITGATFKIIHGLKGSGPFIILNINEQLPDEDYSILTRHRDISLSAGSRRALLYAVYDFLQRLGCCWLAPQFSFYKGQSEWLPKKRILYYNPAGDVNEHPTFSIRKVDIEEGRSHTIENLKQLIAWMPKVRLNTFMVPLNYQGAGKVQWDKWREVLTPELKKRDLLIEVGGHGYQNFLNAKMEDSTLFMHHREWFGKNKKGERDAALNIVFNTANQEAVQYFISNITRYIVQHPEIDIFELWPPDVARWAESADIFALGAPTDRQAALINKVDSALKKVKPGLRLEIIAYGQVLQPPENVKLNSDILVDICPIDQSFEKPIFDTSLENNKGYVKAIYNWNQNFTGDLGLYSYYRKYAWRSLPVLIPHFMQKELQWYKELQFKAISCYSEPGDWYTYELNHYTLAALAWNTSISIDPLMKQYCLLRYGSNADMAYVIYKDLESLVPVYSSIPFTFKKSQEEYKNASMELLKGTRRLSAAIATAKGAHQENLKRLLLMVQYALSDISLLSKSLYDSKDLQPQVERMHNFLQQNAATGVFLPAYSLTTLLRTYNSK
jgi:predicted alpha-1,2-mannosidase